MEPLRSAPPPQLGPKWPCVWRVRAEGELPKREPGSLPGGRGTGSPGGPGHWWGGGGTLPACWGGGRLAYKLTVECQHRCGPGLWGGPESEGQVFQEWVSGAQRSGA